MALYDVTALDALEFSTLSNDGNLTCVKPIPGLNRVVVSYYNLVSSSYTVFVQAFNVNPSSGEITAIGTRVSVFTGSNSNKGTSICMIDDSNFALFWAGNGDDGFCRLFSLDSTGNITANGSEVEYDTSDGRYPVTILMDSTHLLLCSSRTSDLDSRAQIFSFDTSAGTISAVGTNYEFLGGDWASGSLLKLSDSKVLVFFGAGGAHRAAVLDINTSTWAVTLAGSVVTIDSTGGGAYSNSIVLLEDGSPIVVGLMWSSYDNNQQNIQSFNINTSTWEITSKGTLFEIKTSIGGEYINTDNLLNVDDEHVLGFYQGGGDDGFSRVLTYDSSDGSFTTTANEIEFDTTQFGYGSSCKIDSGLYITTWYNAGGWIGSFSVETASLNTTNFFNFM